MNMNTHHMCIIIIIICVANILVSADTYVSVLSLHINIKIIHNKNNQIKKRVIEFIQNDE